MRKLLSTLRTYAGSAIAALKQAFVAPKRVQFAALPYRQAKNGQEYLIVTSRGTGRWIIPKGWPTSDGNPISAVIEEAWEEAGARGVVQPKMLGEYVYRKKLDAGNEIDCRVIVYPFEVKYLANDFPEAGSRKRKWVSAREAAKRVDEPELRSIFLDCERNGMVSLS